FARNVVRDPALDHVRMLAIGSDEATQNLRGAARLATIAAAGDVREFRSTLHALLGIESAPTERAAPLLASVPVAAASPAAGSRRLRGRVLLVEDNLVNLQVARRLLGLAG